MKFIDSVYIKLCSTKKRIEFWRKKGVSIGEDCDIAGKVGFGSEPYLIKIGDHVRITEGCEFVNHDGGVWVVRKYNPDYSDVDKIGEITIGNNVHIGINTIIMPDVHIGNNVVIGAGAVVTRDIPDNCVAAGVPAKPIRSIDEYIAKNKNMYCRTKGMSFEEKKKFLLGDNHEC